MGLGDKKTKPVGSSKKPTRQQKSKEDENDAAGYNPTLSPIETDTSTLGQLTEHGPSSQDLRQGGSPNISDAMPDQENSDVELDQHHIVPSRKTVHVPASLTRPTSGDDGYRRESSCKPTEDTDTLHFPALRQPDTAQAMVPPPERSAVNHRGARPRTASREPNGERLWPRRATNDESLGAELAAGMSQAMREAMHEMSNSMCGAIQGFQHNLERTNKDLMRDIQATVTHAPILNTIGQYENTHPPPTLPRPSGAVGGLRGPLPNAFPGDILRPDPNPNVINTGNATRPKIPAPVNVTNQVQNRNNRLGDDSDDSEPRQPRRNNHHRQRRHYYPDSDDSDDASHYSRHSGQTNRLSDLDERNSQLNFGRRRQRQDNYHTRLPPFNGQEPWKVYYNRFQDIADLQQWTEHEKLRELLPRLQGKAGEFVYGQLSRNVRGDFRQLVKELKHRFRKVETARTFGAQFSSRSQNQGESVEDYAAELKCLYDKAHANRDPATRREDLLRRFLDGLLDDRARFQVEFIKEPDDIDDAVFEVVNFLETRRRTKTIVDQPDRRNRRPARAVRDDGPAGNENEEDGDEEDEDDEEGDDEDGIRAIQNQPRNFNKGKKMATASQGKPNLPQKTKSQTTGDEAQTLKQELELLKKKIEQMEQAVAQPNTVPNPNQGRPYTPRGPVICFRCGVEGHYARECGRSNLSRPTNTNPEQTPSTPLGPVTTSASSSVPTSNC